MDVEAEFHHLVRELYPHRALWRMHLYRWKLSDWQRWRRLCRAAMMTDSISVAIDFLFYLENDVKFRDRLDSLILRCWILKCPLIYCRRVHLSGCHQERWRERKDDLRRWQTGVVILVFPDFSSSQSRFALWCCGGGAAVWKEIKSRAASFQWHSRWCVHTYLIFYNLYDTC